MDIIQVLPDSVANQIAAGEVIQRPASVVKELVENAIDAGAAHIHVNIEDAGKTLIQVIDDGRGMTETDARMAFERHATSKIRHADDLFSLHTMGFRGEALASIAAVAQVELRTRVPELDLGTQINIEGCRVVDQRMIACPVGSNFAVRNLFYNVPARRKFLKSNQTELNNIMQEMERMTLVNPDVAFTLTHNGQMLYTIQASGRLQRIVSVFGRRMHDMLLPVEVDTSMCHISGFVGKPESAKKKGAHQFFFVNNRYMRHPYFHKSVQEAFLHLIPADTQVPYFIYFDVNPADIDVNIHPTKTEIKFENEQAIWQILSASIRESLGCYNAIPTIDFNPDGRIEIPAFEQIPQGREDALVAPSPIYDPTFNPFNTKPSSRLSAIPEYYGVTSKDDIAYTNPAFSSVSQIDVTPDVLASDATDDQTTLLTEPFEKSTNHYQYKGQYIMTSVKSGLMIVDQHRAHVRILYDAYRERMAKHKCVTQGLLFPELVTLSVTDALLLDEIADSLSDVGFDLSPLGGGSYSVNGVPDGLEGVDVTALINGILCSVRDNTSGVEEDVSHRLALELARRQAIQIGEVLTGNEMENLIAQLFACTIPAYAPDGKPTLKILQQQEIDTLFR